MQKESKISRMEFNGLNNCNNKNFVIFNRKNVGHMYIEGLKTSISVAGWEHLGSKLQSC